MATKQSPPAEKIGSRGADDAGGDQRRGPERRDHPIAAPRRLACDAKPPWAAAAPAFSEPEDFADPIPEMGPDGNIVEDSPELLQLAEATVMADSADHDSRHALRSWPTCEGCEIRLEEHYRGPQEWDARPVPSEEERVLTQAGIEIPEPWSPRESLRAKVVARTAALLTRYGGTLPDAARTYDPAADSPEAAYADLREADARANQRHEALQEERSRGATVPPSRLPDPLLALESDKELSRLLIREDARERLQVMRRPIAEPFDAGTLGEILARPETPAMRVAELIPAEGSTLLSAQKKAGKTTFALNLAHALITGDPLLGRFDVVPLTGTVALLNFEVSAQQIARWAAEVGIDHDRLFVVNVRGRSNPLQAGSPDRRALAAALQAQDVETLIVDPFGRAFTGESQNDNGAVQSFLVDLDRFARAEVGAKDLILAAHAGWHGERTRGASALEDWADSIIRLTKDEDGQRYLSAEGRDVLVEEDRLDFDPTTRRLTMTGAGSRATTKRHGKLEELAVLVVAAARDEPGASGRRIVEIIRDFEGAPGFQDRDVRAAARLAEKHGHLRLAAGPKRSLLHYATSAGGGRDA